MIDARAAAREQERDEEFVKNGPEVSIRPKLILIQKAVVLIYLVLHCWAMISP